VNPNGTDYGASLDRTTEQFGRDTLDSLYFWLFLICALAATVLFVWVVLLEKQKQRRLVITKIIVRQVWVSMRVFAALWKETDTALRSRETVPTSEIPTGGIQPLPTALPTFRASTPQLVPIVADLTTQQIDEQQAEIVRLHRVLEERERTIIELETSAASAATSGDRLVITRQLQALEEVANELRTENDELAKENAQLRNKETVSNAHAALARRYESLRVSRNKYQVDMTALRLELAATAVTQAQQSVGEQ
jgi:hypothetical protein